MIIPLETTATTTTSGIWRSPWMEKNENTYLATSDENDEILKFVAAINDDDDDILKFIAAIGDDEDDILKFVAADSYNSQMENLVLNTELPTAVTMSEYRTPEKPLNSMIDSQAVSGMVMNYEDYPENHQFGGLSNSCSQPEAFNFSADSFIETSAPNYDMYGSQEANNPALQSAQMVPPSDFKPSDHNDLLIDVEMLNKYDSESFVNLLLNNNDYSQESPQVMNCGCDMCLGQTINNPWSTSFAPLTPSISQDKAYDQTESTSRYQPLNYLTNQGQLPKLMDPPSTLVMDNLQDSEPPKEKRWTPKEHKMFLEGLKRYGKGKWKKISKNCLPTKSNIQIASHAQKYFRRQSQPKEPRKRKSIHDLS